MVARLALILLWCAAVTAGEAPVDGRFHVVLEKGLPYDDHRHPRDLELRFTIRGGEPDPRGWAYLRQTAATEHPLRITAYERDRNRLRIACEVRLLDQFPYYEGGTATVELDLMKYGHRVVGDYVVRTAVMSQDQRAAAWKREVHVPYDPERIRGRVLPGTRRSQSIRFDKSRWKQPEFTRATGEIRDIPPAARPLSTIPGGAHPRLLAASREALAAAAQRERTVRWLEVIPELLAAGDDVWGRLTLDDHATCHGFAAAGAGLHALVAGEDGSAAAAHARRALAALGEFRDHEGFWRYARELAGLATAYDACHDLWDDDLRREVAARLAAEAHHVAGLEGMVRDSVFNDTGLIGTPDGAWDPRLGVLRAAGLLAALAVVGDDLGTSPLERADVEFAIGACRRSVARYCERGFGTEGAPLGHSFQAEVIEILHPSLFAAERCLGIDLAARTGAREVARWGMADGGMMFDQGNWVDGAWLPLSLHALPDRVHPQGFWHLDRHPPRFANPFQAAWAIASLPAERSPETPDERLRLVSQDHRAGALVLRSGWDHAHDFVTCFETAQGVDAGAGAMGRFSVYGLGREWIRRPNLPSGRLRWPHPLEQNSFQVRENKVVGLPAPLPTMGGKVQRIRVVPSGSGSLGYRSGAYVLPEHRDRSKKLKEPESAYTWSTMGVDYSGASGAQLLLVMVGGHFAFQGREAVWRLDVGDVAEEEVRFETLAFEVRPAGTDATMAGTFVYPGSVRWRYLPPEGARGAVIEARFKEQQVGNDEVFLESMADKIFDLSNWKGPTDQHRGKSAREEKDELGLGMDVEDLLTEPTPEERREASKTALPVKAKIFRVTTSNKMGGPDLGPKVANSAILVLTVQDGEPPEVEAAPINEAPMLYVGEQTVNYWEYLVEFEKGMKEWIRAQHAGDER